jgi:hypothetical protein
MISLRSSPDIRGHGPLSKASRAAAIASFPTPPERVKKVRYCAATEEVFE